MIDSKLYVVTSIFNPRRYKRRYELYHQFAEHIATQPKAVLITVETALRERPFVVTAPNTHNNIQLRVHDEWFIKENLLNIGLRYVPPEAKYVCWVDADLLFIRTDWVDETLHMLQHYPVVQMFSRVLNLDPKHQPFQIWNSFAWSYLQGYPYDNCSKQYRFWHPGFAWAYRKEVLDKFGGLMDRVPLGSGDFHMAEGLIGKPGYGVHGKVSPHFKQYVVNWCHGAYRAVKGDIGYVDGTIMHYWHGRMKDRKYKERWEILVEHQFNPYTDLVRDTQGVLHISEHKHAFGIDTKHYFANRNEDCIYFDPNEDTMK